MAFTQKYACPIDRGPSIRHPALRPPAIEVVPAGSVKMTRVDILRKMGRCGALQDEEYR